MRRRSISLRTERIANLMRPARAVRSALQRNRSLPSKIVSTQLVWFWALRNGPFDDPEEPNPNIS